MNQLKDLKPGVTQITAHPAFLSNELKELTAYDDNREMEFQLFNDPEVKEQIRKQNFKLISWKAIRDLQRKGFT